jgi:hypothetical protein
MPPGGDNPLKVLLLLTLTTILSIREGFNPQGFTTDDNRPIQKVRNQVLSKWQTVLPNWYRDFSLSSPEFHWIPKKVVKVW